MHKTNQCLLSEGVSNSDVEAEDDDQPLSNLQSQYKTNDDWGPVISK